MGTAFCLIVCGQQARFLIVPSAPGLSFYIGGDIQLGLGFGWFVGEGVGDGRSVTLGQGREASLRLPHVSLLRRTREVGVSSTRRRSTIRMDGSADSLPPAGERGSPRGTTGESRKGIKSHMRSASRSGGGSASSLPSLGKGSTPRQATGEWAGGAMAPGLRPV